MIRIFNCSKASVWYCWNRCCNLSNVIVLFSENGSRCADRKVISLWVIKCIPHPASMYNWLLLLLIRCQLCSNFIYKSQSLLEFNQKNIIRLALSISISPEGIYNLKVITRTYWYISVRFYFINIIQILLRTDAISEELFLNLRLEWGISYFTFVVDTC